MTPREKAMDDLRNALVPLLALPDDIVAEGGIGSLGAHAALSDAREARIKVLRALEDLSVPEERPDLADLVRGVREQAEGVQQALERSDFSSTAAPHLREATVLCEAARRAVIRGALTSRGIAR